MRIALAGLQWIAALAVAALIAGGLGAAAMGQFGLASMGAALGDLTWQDRLSVLLHDLQNFGPRYVMLIAGASLATYLIATVGAHFAPGLRLVLFVIAGAAGVLAVVFGLEALFGQPVLKGAQGGMPLAAQALAGALGGVAMARLSRLKRA